MSKSPDISIISDDLRDLQAQTQILEDFDDLLSVHSWEEYSNRVAIVEDIMVFDISLSNYSKYSRNTIESVETVTENKDNLFITFNRLKDQIPKFLERGGVVIALFNDRYRIKMSEYPDDWVVNDQWLLDLGVDGFPGVPSVDGLGRDNIQLTADNDLIRNYFDFVNTVDRTININKSIISPPDVLARNEKDNHPVAASFSEFRSFGSKTQVSNGKMIILPKPSGVNTKPRSIIRTLVELGKQNLPDSPAPTQVQRSSGEIEPLLSDETREQLSDSEFGQEVITHIEKGDECFAYQLWHPALGMYIHAFEWAAIAYLNSEAGINIIEREKDGQYYNFAGGQHSILDELKNHADINQTTISKIEGLNQTERRWMAHHKSGDVLKSDAKSLRSRLGKFLNTVMSNE